MISTKERFKTEEPDTGDEIGADPEQLQIARNVEVERFPRDMITKSAEVLGTSELAVAYPVVADYYGRLAAMEVDWSLSRLSPGQSTT